MLISYIPRICIVHCSGLSLWTDNMGLQSCLLSFVCRAAAFGCNIDSSAALQELGPVPYYYLLEVARCTMPPWKACLPHSLIPIRIPPLFVTTWVLGAAAVASSKAASYCNLWPVWAALPAAFARCWPHLMSLWPILQPSPALRSWRQFLWGPPGPHIGGRENQRLPREFFFEIFHGHPPTKCPFHAPVSKMKRKLMLLDVIWPVLTSTSAASMDAWVRV